MSNDYHAILERLKKNIPSEVSTMEGTWTGNILQAVANELARIYAQEIEPMYYKAFVQHASGADLVNAASDYGISPTPATCAEGMVTITGREGIYTDVVVAADDIIFECLGHVVVPAGGSIDVPVRCQKTGIVGNVPAGAVNRLQNQQAGLDAVYNAAAMSGGYDAETDEALRMRVLERLSTQATSGNIVQYRQWALEVSGVQDVQVQELARGAGTVDVVVIADNQQTPSASLLESVAAHIEEQRPVGADVSVAGALPVEIVLTATVIAKAGYTVQMIQDAVYRRVMTYLQGLSTGVRISYIRMADLLFVEGVEDVADYQLNGNRVSIVLDARSYPAAGLPVITLQEELSHAT